MRIAVITTGGTIAKTYDEIGGSLQIATPVIDQIIAGLRIPDLELNFNNLLQKDSLDFTDDDRRLVLKAVEGALMTAAGVLVIHGTDTLAVTGELLAKSIPKPAAPVVLTGAMRPYEFRDSDALQNVTEALLACRLVSPGIYVAMHNRVLRFPGVVKDKKIGTFIRSD